MSRPKEEPQVNLMTLQHSIPIWMKNLRANALHIDKKSKSLLHLKILAEKKKEIMIVGSGPSLNKMKDHIKNFKGFMIASPSNLSFLLKHGREPDLVHMTDGGPTNVKYFKCLKKIKHNIKFSCSLFSNPNVIEMLPKENIYWFRDDIHLHTQEKREDFWANKAMYFMFPEIRSVLTQLGCVTNSILLVIHHMIKDVKQLDIKKIKHIYLAGVDFTFNEKEHWCDRYHHDGKGWYKVTPLIINGDLEHPKSIITECKLGLTTDQLTRYADTFYNWANELRLLPKMVDLGNNLLRCFEQIPLKEGDFRKVLKE